MKRPLSLVRGRFLQFLGSVVVLHVIAIAAYYSLGIPRAAERLQKLYAWGWMGLTVVVVVVGIQRLKRARRGGPRPPNDRLGQR
ncbi:MAG: hypothetical protein WD801_07635 [Gemmatimonadaceae bacterium]